MPRMADQVGVQCHSFRESSSRKHDQPVAFTQPSSLWSGRDGNNYKNNLKRNRKTGENDATKSSICFFLCLHVNEWDKNLAK